MSSPYRLNPLEILAECAIDVKRLYSCYGVEKPRKQPRRDINTGSMNRKLNTTFNWQGAQGRRIKK